MVFKIGVLKNFAIFTEEHMRLSLLLIKLNAFRPVNLCKKNSNTDFFHVNVGNCFRAPFFIEHFWWLLFYLINSFLKQGAIV